MEGTLADPHSVSSCAVCGSEDCEQFHEQPYPDDYPFLPAGGYDRHGLNEARERPIVGRRKGRGLRWRS